MKRWLVVLTVLSLMILILPSCSDNKEETAPPLTEATPTAISTPSMTPSPTTVGPVKIGAITAWSGPMAAAGVLADQMISLLEWQVQNMGGILGGRAVKFVKGDDRGVVAESAAQAEKLILDDKVSVLTLGGISGGSFGAVANVAEELKVPYVSIGSVLGVSSREYSVVMLPMAPFVNRIVGFVTNVLKVKTFAYLAQDDDGSHQIYDGLEEDQGIKDKLETEGINSVYEQYFSYDTVDFTPYLTKIKYLKPDVLITICLTPHAITINKQIAELGGWGGMKYLAASEAGGAKTAITQPSAAGTYVSVGWLAGSNDPGMMAFENAYKEKYSRLPSTEATYFYNCFWIAIKAIQIAGTDDPVDIAHAMRSGKLVWDSAWGTMSMGTNGKGNVDMMVAQVKEGGTLVKVWPQ
jgi:branched-chain amino acid transport system substrate-binding protein